MTEQTDRQAAGLPMGWSANGVLEVGARLWSGMRRRCAEYQRRRVAAAMYAALSKLSDDELECRGIARDDLARYCGLKSFSTDV